MKNLCLTFSLFFAVNIQAQNVWDGGGNIPTITTNGSVGIGGSSASTRFYLLNTITANGLVNSTTSSLTGTQTGLANNLNVTGASGVKYGIYNTVASATSSPTYSIYNNSNMTGTGTKYGYYSSLGGTGTGTGYGIYSVVSGTSTVKYGIYTVANNTGSNSSSSDATSFGLFSQGTGANSRAGYFKGDVEINQGNTIYANSNGSKTLILEHAGAGDYTYSINMNQTDNMYDWSFNRSFKLNRAGEMIKGCDNALDVFMIKRYDLGGIDVFKVKGDGKVFATEINVQLTPFPDYVFKPDYNLLPLSEVLAYIQTNGHLPNVPTAETVAIEGANLGEMTKTLVEKVEELTLYLLQQQEQLELQKATLELQQTQIEALKLQLAAPKQ
jgi:hypothetical protein